MEALGVAARTTWYRVRLTCRLRPSVSWTLQRRFSHFLELARALSAASFSDREIPPLPPKLMLQTGGEQRRRVVGLQRFCELCLSDPSLLSDWA
eukprot:6150354-Prymnesium_polylepis.1